MKYVKLYDTHVEHESEKSELMKLDYACTYCKDNQDSWFWYKKDIYADQYLTFESLEDDNTFGLSYYSFYYSLDNGQTWTRNNNNPPVINAGEKIMLKASITPLGTNARQGQPRGVGTFSSTGNFNVMGNPLSLIFSDNFIGQTDLTGLKFCFEKLFYNCNKLISAEHLSLPATTLADACYGYMFGRCTSLTIVPILPATTLVQSCYQNMFQGCTSLTTAPELSATTLANTCYQSMFQGCTSLTTAPKLPATTLANTCYSNMFQGCTSLTIAPELPAITLTPYCYTNMFTGCTSLNYIKAMFTTKPGETRFHETTGWVSGVSSTGTFIKNSAATWDVTGTNGVPSGWTVQYADS